MKEEEWKKSIVPLGVIGAEILSQDELPVAKDIHWNSSFFNNQLLKEGTSLLRCKGPCCLKKNLLHTSCLTPFDHVFLRHERGWRCRKRSGGQVQFYEGHWCRDFEAVTSAKDIHWNFVLFSNTKRLLSEGTSVTPRRQYRDEQI